jgi:hypothetical protein
VLSIADDGVWLFNVKLDPRSTTPAWGSVSVVTTAWKPKLGASVEGATPRPCQHPDHLPRFRRVMPADVGPQATWRRANRRHRSPLRPRQHDQEKADVVDLARKSGQIFGEIGCAKPKATLPENTHISASQRLHARARSRPSIKEVNFREA